MSSSVLFIKKKLRHSTFLFALFRSCYHCVLRLKQTVLKKWIAFASRRLKLLYAPLAYFFKKRGMYFAINCAPGVGHVALELDYLYRLLEEENIPTKRCAVLLYPCALSKGAYRWYGDDFYLMTYRWFSFAFFMPLALLFPSLCIDIGHSRLTWLKKDSLDRPSHPTSFPYALYQLDYFKDGNKRYALSFALRKKTKERYFLKKQQQKAIEKLRAAFSFSQNERLCLIHLKEGVGNATGAPTDPHSYLPSLQFLKHQGYTLVFVGRENMPTLFRSLDVIDYASSKHASFENDIALFHIASLALVGGSGISYLADCLGVPLLYINSWHLAFFLFSEKTLMLPARVRVKKTGALLTWKEQIELIEKSARDRDDLDLKKYEAVNATGDEIFAALLELLNPTHHDSHLFEQFYSDYHMFGTIEHSQHKISTYFLEKYPQDSTPYAHR